MTVLEKIYKQLNEHFADRHDKVEIVMYVMGILEAHKMELVEEVVKKFSSNSMLADSLPLSELKQTLYEVNTLISGWNATEAEWSEWDKEVQQKVNDLQAKLDGNVSGIREDF